MIPALVAGLLLAACGGAGTGAHTAGPKRTYRVDVTATFPKHQRLAEHSRLVIAVRNPGHAAIPNVAVTLVNPSHRAAQALGTLLPPPKQGQPLLASRSRPIWIVDRAPGPCDYRCEDGGPGGAATADPNTWALGRLKPGQTARFAWRVTAIEAGRHRIGYTVAAGLDGEERAVTSGGKAAGGELRVEVSSIPSKVRVEPDGRVRYR